MLGCAVGVVRYLDKALTDANIIRVIDDSNLADTREAATNALAKLSDTKRWPWLPDGEKVFDWETRWRYCLRTAVTWHGIDQFEWLKTRQLRIAFQYTLPKWGNILVSTLDRDDADEKSARVAVNIIVQTVRVGL